MAIKLIQLNVERSRHWDRVIPFLEKEQADVVCLEEIFESEISKIEALGYQGVFSSMFNKRFDRDDKQSVQPMGIAIFSKLPIIETEEYFYYQAPRQDIYLSDQKRLTTSHVVRVVKIETEEKVYTIALTHFTWTPDGMSSPEQQEDMTSLLAYLEKFDSLILVGDFNIPRGYNEQYERLAERYVDWVPKNLTCSLDPDYHRVAKDPVGWKRISKYMVDYVFSTSDLVVQNVIMTCGLSDHCALVGEVEPVKPRLVLNQKHS